jgi:hypothetical protein
MIIKNKILLIFLIFGTQSFSQYFKAELYFLNGTNKSGIAKINTLNDKSIVEKSEKKECKVKDIPKIVHYYNLNCNQIN